MAQEEFPAMKHHTLQSRCYWSDSNAGTNHHHRVVLAHVLSGSRMRPIKTKQGIAIWPNNL